LSPGQGRQISRTGGRRTPPPRLWSTVHGPMVLEPLNLGLIGCHAAGFCPVSPAALLPLLCFLLHETATAAGRDRGEAGAEDGRKGDWLAGRSDRCRRHARKRIPKRLHRRFRRRVRPGGLPPAHLVGELRPTRRRPPDTATAVPQTNPQTTALEIPAACSPRRSVACAPRRRAPSDKAEAGRHSGSGAGRRAPARLGRIPSRPIDAVDASHGVGRTTVYHFERNPALTPLQQLFIWMVAADPAGWRDAAALCFAGTRRHPRPFGLFSDLASLLLRQPRALM
jgi:hypothetical protein